MNTNFCFSKVAKYTNQYSTFGNSMSDLQLGFDHNQVGDNRSMNIRHKQNTLIIVASDVKDNMGYVALVVKKHEGQSIWNKKDSSCDWKHTFVAIPVTEIMELPRGSWKQVHPQFMTIAERNECGNMMLKNAKHLNHAALAQVNRAYDNACNIQASIKFEKKKVAAEIQIDNRSADKFFDVIYAKYDIPALAKKFGRETVMTARRLLTINEFELRFGL